MAFLASYRPICNRSKKDTPREQPSSNGSSGEICEANKPSCIEETTYDLCFGDPLYKRLQKLMGNDKYNGGVQHGIDPVFALAFFWHESNFGTKGEAQYSKSLGNLQCIDNEASCTDGYAWSNSWEDGYTAWYDLIANLYGGPHCQDKIGPIFRKTKKFERVPTCYLLSTPFAA